MFASFPRGNEAMAVNIKYKIGMKVVWKPISFAETNKKE
jgi:hypothetical protein